MNIESIKISELSIRSKQSIGAIFLYEASLLEKKLTADLGGLISHQFSILVAGNLPNWEKDGVGLVVNGRGDDLDEANKLVFGDDNIILDLIDFSTEIALSCMYTSDFDRSTVFLIRCIEVIKKMPHNEIMLMKDFSDFDAMHAPDWGPVISAEKFFTLKQKHIPLVANF